MNNIKYCTANEHMLLFTYNIANLSPDARISVV